MLREQPLIPMLLLNLLFGTLWHYLIFFLCITRGPAAFSPSKRRYQPRKWEQGGKFYHKALRINRWKDRLPQHISKGGFSKDHLDSLSIEYIDRFITETCRGEWNHSVNCLYAVVLILLNDLPTALVWIVLLLLGNLPFVCIQRYNRFRLQKLRKALLRRAEKRTSPEKQSSQTALSVTERANNL